MYDIYISYFVTFTIFMNMILFKIIIVLYFELIIVDL